VQSLFILPTVPISSQSFTSCLTTHHLWGQVGGEGRNELGKILMEVRSELCSCAFCRIRRDSVLSDDPEDAEIREAFEVSGGGTEQEFEEFKSGWGMGKDI
jgi:hypothetical protein